MNSAAPGLGLARAKYHQYLLGPIIVLITTIAMLIWSWGTWPDPLVDFGAQLYFPWQLLSGKVLYRDIAFFNGPLSQYFNACLFRIAGVSLRTLVIGDLAILTGLMVVIYRLTLNATGYLSATAVSITFALVFAFGQGVGVGNFNWVTPYTHEITHGVFLGLLTIACLSRSGNSDRHRFAWIAIAGVLLGTTFLTKAEPFAATAVATAAYVLCRHSRNRCLLRDVVREITLLVAFGTLAPIVALFLLHLRMPWSEAAKAVAGSWPWLFDSRITSLPFYRRVSGFDDIFGNLKIMSQWSLLHAAVLVPAVIFARRTRPASKATAVVVFVGVAGILGFFLIDTFAYFMIRPLPIVLVAILAIVFRSRKAIPVPQFAFRVAIIVYSLVLLSKIALTATVFHYGFALAMPGTLVVVAFAIDTLPKWVKSKSGNHYVMIAAVAAVWIISIASVININARFFQNKKSTIGKNGDSYRIDQNGQEVEAMLHLFDEYLLPTDTLAVFPQGLMLNYLTRRTNPIYAGNFMPPEVLAVGEENIIRSLIAHPPDAIVLNLGSIRNGQFTLDEHYLYGGQTITWIGRNYKTVATADKLALLKRK